MLCFVLSCHLLLLLWWWEKVQLNDRMVKLWSTFLSMSCFFIYYSPILIKLCNAHLFTVEFVTYDGLERESSDTLLCTVWITSKTEINFPGPMGGYSYLSYFVCLRTLRFFCLWSEHRICHGMTWRMQAFCAVKLGCLLWGDRRVIL
jgi:hypothetical protein